MKKVALIIVIACCLWSCKNNIIVDGNDSTHVVCVKNNQQKNISTKLIGITEDKAKEYGYSLLTVISPNSSVEIFKGMVGWNELDFYLDSVYFYDSNNVISAKEDIISLQRKSNQMKIDDTSTQFTYEVD